MATRLAPDLQHSARRREERLALLREESGTWLAPQPAPCYGSRCYLCNTPRPNMRSTRCSWCDGAEARKLGVRS